MTMNFVKTMAVAGGIALLAGPALAGGPAVLAASESTSIAGAAAGAQSNAGGGKGGGGGSASTKEGDTIAAAVGFPASPSGPDCTNSYGVVWNFFWQVYDSPACEKEADTNNFLLVRESIGDTPGHELTASQLDAANYLASQDCKAYEAFKRSMTLGGFIARQDECE